MKVLGIYSTDQMLGGGEISFTLSLQLVQKSGWEVLAAVPGLGPLSEYLEKSGITSAVLPQRPLREDLAARHLLFPQPAWLELCRKFRPDLIHCNAVRPALYAQALSREHGIPAIMHARKAESLPIVDLFLTCTLAAIISTSEVVRRRFRRGLGRCRVEVLHNPVDLEQFERPTPRAAELRQEWSMGAGMLVGVIGRLSPIKGQHWMIQAAPEVILKVPETRFVFIGSEDPCFPGYEMKLRSEIQRRGIVDKFLFAGYQDDLPSAYHALDLVVFPTSSEGFGRVIIEAGAARKPLVASDIDVVREVLSPELEDLTVPLGQAKPLAERIARILEDPALGQELANRLHEHVGQHFGLEAHRRKLLWVYDQVIMR